MIETAVTIINKLGLHARAAAKFVNTAQKFASVVKLSNDGRTIDGKSIMSVMMLGASQGVDLTLRVDGDDEKEATEALTALIESRFEEEE
ncbi:MAG: HPr family phosphocarrier protein [Gammaproteobacteria bacterium]|jgi:phosphocarrier protein|nr:HPr family phosphocarrier protein [Gammaproteobacteria bacterium]